MARNDGPAARYRRALQVYQDTSREAWEAFQEHLPSTDRLIVAEIKRMGGAHSESIEEITGLRHQTVSAQIRHMVEAGVLVDSGRKAKTQSGRSAIVWELAAPAVDRRQGDLFEMGAGRR